MIKSVPLYGRFLLWLGMSLGLSVWVLLIVAPQQLGIGLSIFLSDAVRARLLSIGQDIAADVGPVLGEHWKVELKRYDHQHGVRFSIYNSDGTELAGQEQSLPAEVAEQVHETLSLMQSEGPAGIDAVLPKSDPARPLELPGWPRPTRRLLMRSIFVVQPEREGPYWIGIRVPIPTANGGLIPATILAQASGVWRALRFLSFTGWLAFVALLAVLTAAVGAPLLWSVSSALGKITRATQRIADEQFDARVNVKREDELGRLADSVNTVAGRLESFVKGQRQFLANVTHEVTSPLARLQMGLETLKYHVGPEGERIFQDVQEEVQVLSDLAAELLAFSRAGMSNTLARTATVSLRALVLSVLERERGSSAVVVKVPGELNVRVSPSSLGRALGNLVRNALRYAGTLNGPIEVVAEPLGKSICIRVMDRGPGVPKLSLINLGDPFYRPELARQRTTGGLGLGLATVKNCVAACDGTVTFRNRKGGGFEAEIMVPMSEAPGKLARRRALR